MNSLIAVLILGVVAVVVAFPMPQRHGKGKAGKYRHPGYEQEGYNGGYRPHPQYSGVGMAGAGASASASAGGFAGTHGGLGGHGGHGGHGASGAHSNAQAQSHSHTASLGLGPFSAGLGLSHAQASANSGAASHIGHGYRPASGYYDY